ncbi:cupin domain-containing protein [Microbulbifer epialgicus]|uniref:Cupin domain-containing protein n=1 Tax=Microbulbifer epialgicus TaxID=393907 RepID=A0ABV4P417_9GAMM
MASRTLTNPRTGERIIFTKTSRETNGKLFEMSYKMAPHAAIVDEYSHPHQEMAIRVLSGTLTCSVNGVNKKLCAGEGITIPAGVPHFQKNEFEVDVHAI